LPDLKSCRLVEHHAAIMVLYDCMIAVWLSTMEIAFAARGEAAWRRVARGSHLSEGL
jgi:hypothetical protein